MVQKVEINVERYQNGITLKWKDVNSDETEKALAVNGNEPLAIGKEIWEDLRDIFDNALTDEIAIKIEYSPKKL